MCERVCVRIHSLHYLYLSKNKVSRVAINSKNRKRYSAMLAIFDEDVDTRCHILIFVYVCVCVCGLYAFLQYVAQTEQIHLEIADEAEQQAEKVRP